MFCPNCGSKFKKIITKSHYGAKIEIDQCSKCGGIWCDKLEMYKISPKQGIEIDKVDLSKIRQLKLIKKDLICPKCKKPLKKFSDPFFPKQIQLDCCFSCGGFWFNRGELTQFKKWQQEKIMKFSQKELSEKDKEFIKDVKRLMELQKSDKDDMFAKVGKFLTQPVSRFKPYDKVDSSKEKKMAIAYIIFQLINFVIKAVIKK